MQVDKTSFRSNEEFAREVFEFLLPDEKTRRICLKFLADSVQIADRLGSDRWGITLYSNCVRMNCGMIEVLTIVPAEIHVITDKDIWLERLSKQVKVTKGEGKGFYPSVPGSVACDFIAENAEIVLPQLASPREKIIQKASRTAFAPNRQHAHSPGVINYLASHLGITLPQPAYFTLEQEEKYSGYLRKWGKIVEFHDAANKAAHNLFQRWRRENWDDGFFINCKSRRHFILHRANCSHPGDGEWANKDGGGLTKYKKACSVSIRELFNWAKQNPSAKLEACKDCELNIEALEADFLEDFSASETAPLPDVDQMSISGLEGRKRLVLHLRRERNRKIVEAKKQQVLSKAGKLSCEACGFDFKVFYGERGKDFCEVHHKMALAEVDEEVETQLEDLAILCSNCHRMIHKAPMLSLETLKSLLT